MKTGDRVPQLIRDLVYATDHRLLDTDEGQAAALALRYGLVDDLVVNLIQEPIRRHAVNQAFLGPFALPHLTRGDTTLGTDLVGRSLPYPRQVLNGHSITVAGSGGGKTLKAKFFIEQIAAGVNGLWCFDFAKDEFASMRPILARRGIDLLVVPARKLRVNPLQCPEGASPHDWAPRIADSLVSVLRLQVRSSKQLHATILKLYHEFGVLDGAKRYPTLFHVREAIASDPDANPQAKYALVDSIDQVLLSIPDALRWEHAWTTGELAKRHIVFQFAGISDVDKNLLLTSLVLPEFVSRVARGISNPKMDLWICCDEAARLVTPGSQVGAMTDLISRGTGIGLDLSVQSADVIGSVVSNTACKFLGRCGAASDYNTIGAAMGLTADQRRWASLNLTPGMFVGQFGEGEWRRPFVFKIPQPSTTPSMKQRDLADGLEDLNALKVVEATEFRSWQPTSPRKRSFSPPRDVGTTSEADVRFIRAVVENPGTASSKLPRLAGMSPKRAQEIRRRLVRKGYLREHRVNTGLRGRATLVLEPLEPASRIVEGLSEAPK